MAKAVKKPERRVAVVPVVVEPEPQDVIALRSDASMIQQFVGGMRVFFERANLLEMEAKANLVRMETRALPTNGDDDHKLQEDIRAMRAHKGEAESHWEITALISRVHRRLTSKRAIATDADDRAITIGNSLHNRYADNARAAARAEEERIRREAEDRQRREREAELAELEKQRLKAEANSPDLSAREQSFVDAYTSEVTGWKGNGKRAAEVAQYKDPDATAARLLNTPKIKKAIDSAETAKRLKQQAQAIREAPVEVEHVEVRPDLTKGGERTTWGAEIINEQALIDAVIRGEAPRSLLMGNRVAVNDLGKKLRENVDRIPGLRHTKKTGVI